MNSDADMSNSPIAIIIRVACNNAVLDVGHDKGIHKVPLAFVLLVAISSRATVTKKDNLKTPN